MSQQIEAIYDNGVLKPLVPLWLPDKARVKLTVEAAAPAESSVSGETSRRGDSEELARQQAALDELRQEIEKVPQARNNDGWSVRQHDELLYGGKK